MIIIIISSSSSSIMIFNIISSSTITIPSAAPAADGSIISRLPFLFPIPVHYHSYPSSLLLVLSPFPV